MLTQNTNTIESAVLPVSALSISSNVFLPSPNATNGVHALNNNVNNQTNMKPIRRFSCSVCNIDCVNQQHFNSHLNSQQHHQTQSIYDMLQSVAPEYRSTYKAMFSTEMLNKKVFSRQLLCEQEINETPKPLLGLNYIIEFQFENLTDPPQYICELCHVKCSSKSILEHLLNNRHQLKFFKVHHQDMYERVLSASNIRSEQIRLIENYAKQIQTRHGGPGQIQLRVQLDSLIGHKPIVLAVIFKTPPGQTSKSHKTASIQLTSKTFEEYDYEYEDELDKRNEKLVSEITIKDNDNECVQLGLSQQDLLYPFDREFWYRNYKDLLRSRPLDPHAVTYEEIIHEPSGLQAFQAISKHKSLSPVPDPINENHLTLENRQTIRRNTSQPSNRRVILDTNRTPILSDNGILRISPTEKNFDGYALLNGQQNKSNPSNAVLNEQSARAILAASGLLYSDEESEKDFSVPNSSTRDEDNRLKKNSDKLVSPLIAKRMLDAVLSGDLDVVHIQPYFSTFVDLIQSGQVELERHQAERLLHKILVTSSSSSSSTTATTMIKDEPVVNSKKRTRSPSHFEDESCSVSKSKNQHSDEYSSSKELNSKGYSSSTSKPTYITNEYNRSWNGKRSIN